jgi:predicted nucleic acid-binding protein
VNALVVDTSIWIAYFKGEPFPEVDYALGEARVHLPVMVVAELLSARLAASKRRELREFLVELPLAGSSMEHWSAVGELRARCSTRGFALSTPDAHIAQCALELGAELLSGDRVFEQVARVAPLKLASYS